MPTRSTSNGFPCLRAEAAATACLARTRGKSRGGRGDHESVGLGGNTPRAGRMVVFNHELHGGFEPGRQAACVLRPMAEQPGRGDSVSVAKSHQHATQDRGVAHMVASIGAYDRHFAQTVRLWQPMAAQQLGQCPNQAAELCQNLGRLACAPPYAGAETVLGEVAKKRPFAFRQFTHRSKPERSFLIARQQEEPFQPVHRARRNRNAPLGSFAAQPGRTRLLDHRREWRSFAAQSAIDAAGSVFTEIDHRDRLFG